MTDAAYIGLKPFAPVNGHDLVTYVALAAAVVIALYAASALDRWWRP